MVWISESNRINRPTSAGCLWSYLQCGQISISLTRATCRMPLKEGFVLMLSRLITETVSGRGSQSLVRSAKQPKATTRYSTVCWEAIHLTQRLHKSKSGHNDTTNCRTRKSRRCRPSATRKSRRYKCSSSRSSASSGCWNGRGLCRTQKTSASSSSRGCSSSLMMRWTSGSTMPWSPGGCCRTLSTTRSRSRSRSSGSSSSKPKTAIRTRRSRRTRSMKMSNRWTASSSTMQLVGCVCRLPPAASKPGRTIRIKPKASWSDFLFIFPWSYGLSLLIFEFKLVTVGRQTFSRFRHSTTLPDYSFTNVCAQDIKL